MLSPSGNTWEVGRGRGREGEGGRGREDEGGSKGIKAEEERRKERKGERRRGEKHENDHCHQICSLKYKL